MAGHTWSDKERADRIARNPPEARLMRRVEFEMNTGCWLWTGSTNNEGYGKIGIGGRLFLTHRVSYEMHKGPIPPGRLALHKCDTPACCNPDHLFLGGFSDNHWDMRRKGRANYTLGEDRPSAKFRSADIPVIRQRVARGETCGRVATDYGVTQGSIRAIVTGRSWKHIHSSEGPDRANNPAGAAA